MACHPSSQPADDSGYDYDGRSKHGPDASGRDEEECTFQPKIRPLPSYYGSQKALEAVPFEKRVMQWQKHKDEELTKKREAEVDGEVQ